MELFSNTTPVGAAQDNHLNALIALVQCVTYVRYHTVHVH